jgi:tungstate transport system permease protein
VAYIWHQLEAAWPLIWVPHGFVQSVTVTTLRVAVVSTGSALILGLPVGLALGLGQFRSRRVLNVLANVSLGVPPVLVGIFVLLLTLQGGLLGRLRIDFTLNDVYLAQTLLALPYVVALSAAAFRGLPPGLLSQARLLGAGRIQLSVMALREARIGVIAAVIAALASTLSEVAAVIIVGANVLNADQTLGSAIINQLDDYDNIPEALALGIVLLALIFILIGILTVLQQRAPTRLRWRGA